MHGLFTFFKSTTLFTGQKKPNQRKNFFQNYSDHIDCLFKNDEKFIDQLNDSMVENNLSNLLSDITKETIKHLNLFDALYDGYDYADEVLCATGIYSAIGIIAFIGLSINAAVECSIMLGIKMGLMQDYGDDNINQASTSLILAGMALALSAVVFMKSLISLFTRPIITLINGHKEQDVVRFHNKDSVAGKLDKFAKDALSDALSVCSELAQNGF